MKIQKTILLSILFLILLTISVSAETTYTQLGGNNSDFMQERGYDFSNSNTDITQASTSGSGVIAPLVADLDNDGTNEIISLDSGTLILSHYSSLDFVKSYSISFLGSRPYMMVYDIDGDNYEEIIVGSNNQYISILEYNGTHFYNQTELTLTNANDGDVVFNCEDTDTCVVLYNKDNTGVPSTSTTYLYAQAFNSSSLVGSRLTIASDNGDSTSRRTGYCLPRIKTLQALDYDSDGDVEYAFSYVQYAYNWPAPTSAKFGYVYFNGSDVVLESTDDFDIEASFLEYQDIRCSDNKVDALFTSPLMGDLSYDANYETIIGYMENTNDFEITMYKADGVKKDNYPDAFSGNGQIVSNLFLADIFTDTNDDDFCILGFDSILGELDLMCSSEKSGYFDETYEFAFDVTGLSNITDTYGSNQFLTHSGQHVVNTQVDDNKDIDEIITSYGILQVEWIEDNEILYNNPHHPSILLSVDVENVGREDLLAQTKTNLWYLDDGYSTSGGTITHYCINPCLQTWKVNTTAEIIIEVSDVDLDQTSSQATLYEGDVYEMVSGWSANKTSGSSTTFSFIANETIGSSNILLEGRDTSNPSEIDEIYLSFSVGSTGVEYGDCQTCITIALEDEDEEQTAQEQAEEDTQEQIQNVILGCDENGENCAVGSGWLPLIGFLVVILSAWGGMESGKSMGLDSVHAFYTGIMTGFLGFIFCIWIGWLSYWMLLVMVLFSAGLVAFALRDKFNGNSGGL